MKIYWTKMQIGEWHVYCARTDQGLCYIGSPNASFNEMETWINKRFKNLEVLESEQGFQLYKEQLQQYIEGERQTFTIPLDLYGTNFQQSVWKVLQTIPFGETISYMDVAEKLQNPRAVRAVGGAIGANPVLIAVPCHRVITKDGKLGGFRAGLPMKKQLLEIEGNGLSAN